MGRFNFDDILSPMQLKSLQAYDEFLEKAFEPYGINRKNIAEMRNRITAIRHEHIGDQFQTIEEFYIDGKFAFTIKKTLRCDENESGSISLVEDLELKEARINEI